MVALTSIAARGRVTTHDVPVTVCKVSSTACVPLRRTSRDRARAVAWKLRKGGFIDREEGNNR